MSKLEQSIEGLRTLQGSYDAMATAQEQTAASVATLTALDSDIKAGKEALARNITAKGVPTAEDASLQTMAEKVGSIAQKQYTIDGNTIKDAQNYADGTLYDLYAELYKIKNNIHIQSRYQGIVLCQYFRGYDSLDLSLFNADAYLTCDGDFYDYRTTHTWHDENTGKVDRWVAFLFQDGENGIFTIPSTEQCPRKVFIGGHMKQLVCTVAGRIAEVVVPDELDENGVQVNVLRDINFGSTQNWGQNVVIRNVSEHFSSKSIIRDNSAINYVSIGIKRSSGYVLEGSLPSANYISFPCLEEVDGGNASQSGYGIVVPTSHDGSIFSAPNVISYEFPNLKTIKNGGFLLGTYNTDYGKNLVLNLPSLEVIDNASLIYSGRDDIVKIIENEINMPSLKKCSTIGTGLLGTTRSPSITTMIIGCKGDPTDVIDISRYYENGGNSYSNLTDLRIGDDENLSKGLPPRWEPRQILNFTAFRYLSAENIVEHILKRLGDNNDGNVITITLGSGNLAKLTTEEKQIAIDKNYRLA